MYLHKDDKELLRDIIVTVSERTGIDESIVVHILQMYHQRQFQNNTFP